MGQENKQIMTSWIPVRRLDMLSEVIDDRTCYYALCKTHLIKIKCSFTQTQQVIEMK